MSDDVTRKGNPDRFEITSDQQVAGFAQFVDVGKDRVFFHTVIDEEFGGRGLAGTVVSEAMAATRDEGLRIVPVCPFVQGYIAKHPEWAEHVTEPTAEHQAAARAAG